MMKANHPYDNNGGDEDTRNKILAALSELPSDCRGPFDAAFTKAHGLVMRESNPLWFLRSVTDQPDKLLAPAGGGPLSSSEAERLAYQKAAKKLAMYWSKRTALFGERAILPLSSQIGERSALSKKDAALLKTSPLYFLPQDDGGRQVYLLDTSKINSSFQNVSEIRCIFYQLQQSLYSNESSSTSSDGIILILHVPDYRQHRSTNDTEAHLKKIIQFLSEMIGETMPLFLRRFHMVVSHQQQDSQLSSSVISSCIKLAIETHLSDECVATSANSPDGLLRKLKHFGLGEESLPPALGGSYCCSLKPAPATNLRQDEGTGEALYRPPETNISAQKARAPNDLPASDTCQLDDSNPSTADEREAAQQLKRKRERNALYSRRKYHRTKIEMEVREQEVKRAKDENENLKQEQHRLESLLALAQQTVQMHEHSAVVTRMPAPRESQRQPYQQLLQPQQQQQPCYSSPTMMWLAQARMPQEQQLRNRDLDTDRKPAPTTTRRAVPPQVQHSHPAGMANLAQLAAATMTAATAAPASMSYGQLTSGHGGAQQLSGGLSGGVQNTQENNNHENPLISLFANRAAASTFSHPSDSTSTQGRMYGTGTSSSSSTRAPENSLNILNQLLGILGGTEAGPATTPSGGIITPSAPALPAANTAGHGGGGIPGVGLSAGSVYGNLDSTSSGQTLIERLLSSTTTAPANSSVPTPANPHLIDSQVQPLFAVGHTNAGGDDGFGDFMQSSQGASTNDQLDVLKAAALLQGGSGRSSSSEGNTDEEAGKKPAATR